MAMCVGDVIFYSRPGYVYGLQPLGRGKDKQEQLFGLTWIFPWAQSIIRDIFPNCIILDGTFRSMRPYTLIVIEAAIANESIPIGLSISPTEKHDVYERLYAHLAEVLGEGGADLLKRIPVLSDQGRALKTFVRKLGLRWLACHRHLIQSAGASSLVGDWVRRLLDCGNVDEARPWPFIAGRLIVCFSGRCLTQSINIWAI
jgi:hypothetical protein